MNQPPATYRLVFEPRLLEFITECFTRSGCEDDHAALIARLLVNNDLRGVRSHGTQSAAGYCNGLADGAYNPRPVIRTVHETDSVVVLDGDGTVGYLPTVQAAERAVEKAKSSGIGLGLVRHIGHYGSAGHYSRICLEHGCIGFSTQGYRHEAEPRDPPGSAVDSGNPPFSFAFPAADETPVVLDGGSSLFSPYHGEGYEDLPERIPAVIFKSMGLIAASTFLGGALTGFTGARGDEIESRWKEAYMGGMVSAIDVDRICDSTAFRQEVDRYVRGIRDGYLPVSGTDRALLPGALEAERMERYRREGIPYGEPEQQAARSLSERFDVPLPWEAVGP